MRASLSGRSLIALLITLWDTRAESDALDADWVLAATVYDRITRELDTITAGAGHHTVRITLDDGITPDTPETEQTTDPAPDPDASPQST